MSEGNFLLARTRPDPYLKTIKTAAFGTAGFNVSSKFGRLYHATATNGSATAYFFQVHDSAIAPTAGAVPRWERRLAANLDCDLYFGECGLELNNGLSFAISTTQGTLTLASANDCTAYCQYTVSTT
jgi:hypothetical protein